MKMSDDDFVESLIKGLPNAEPMSEMELKRFEKFVDSEIGKIKNQGSRRLFNQRLSIAASVIVAFLGLGLFVSQPNLVDSAPKQPSTESPIEPVKPTSSITTPNPSSPPKGQGNGVFGNDGSIVNEKNFVPIFSTGKDYAAEIQEIKSLVKLSIKPKSTASLTSQQRNCAIELGVDESLLAIDKGYFDGDPIFAFYVGPKNSDFVIKISTFDCQLVGEL